MQKSSTLLFILKEIEMSCMALETISKPFLKGHAYCNLHMNNRDPSSL